MKSVPTIRSRSTARWLAFPAILFVLAATSWAEVPNAIAHQGRIVVTGVNFQGNGQFKFLLFADADTDHASGNETPIWSNATTTPAAMTEPASAVTVTVTKGLYGTWLGDTTIANMAALPASVEPPAGTRLYLRVWFSDGVAPFVALAPDQAIAAVPFALSAAGVTAGGVTVEALADGAVTAAKIAPGAVTAAKIAPGAVTAAKIAPGAVTGAVLGDGSITSEKLAIGAVTELGIPQTNGSMSLNPLVVFRDFDNTGIGGGVCMAVDGDFAYQASTLGRFIIFDVSDPANIVQRGLITGGLGNITSIVAKDGIAYLLDDADARLIVLDVSDPDSITQLSTIPTGLFSSSNRKIALSGQTIYAIGQTNGTTMVNGLLFLGAGRLQAIDVSNPAAPVLSGSSITNLARPSELAISGSTAVVIDIVFDHVALFDISNPANITARDTDNSVVVGESEGLAVSGNLGYYLDSEAEFGSMQVFDFSDPDNIVARGSLLTSSSGQLIALTGNLAIVTDSSSKFFRVIDISDPDNPVLYDRYPSVFNGNYLVGILGNRLMISSPAGQLETLEIIPALSASGGLGVTGEMNVSGLARFREIRVATRVTANVIEAQTLTVSGTVFPTSLNDTTATRVTVSGPLTAASGAFTGAVTSGSANITGTVSANNFVYPTPKSFALSIPGNAMLAQSAPDDFFRSTIGFIRPRGVATSFTGVAPVQLPQGATITGMDIIYYDDSVGNSFTNLTTRLRRLDMFSTSGSPEQNIIALDVPSPSSPNSTTLVRAINNSPEATRNVVDNTNFQYFVSVGATVTAPDADLRFYGFRIRYTLKTLAP